MNYNDNDNAGKSYQPGDDPGDMLEVGIMLDEEQDSANTLTAEGSTGESKNGLPENPPETSHDDKQQAVSHDGEAVPDTEDQRGDARQHSEHADILNEIRSIGRRIEDLTAHFEGKIKYDAHKNRIIDDLHEQLQDFRDGIIKKHLHSMITDIIKIIDDTRKFKSHHENTVPTENAAGLMLDFMEQIISDLEDLFTFQGIYPFTCAGEDFDSHRQRIIKKIDTDLPEKNRLVAESLRPGYEWEGKVIRPEMVAVYIYNDTLNNKAGES